MMEEDTNSNTKSSQGNVNENTREFGTQTGYSPTQTTPNKRFKSEKQFIPVGIACVTSPNKSPSKSPSKSPKRKTPQKNTLDNYFNLSSSPKKNSSQLENYNLEDPQPSVSGSSRFDQLPKTPEKSNAIENDCKNDIILKTPEKLTPSDIPSDDTCERPNTPEKLEKMRNGNNNKTPSTPEKFQSVVIVPDDDIDHCDLPTNETYNEMLREGRERELSQPIASTSTHDCNVLSQQSTPTLMTCNTLPEDIFEMIFSHLSIRKICMDITRVCKHWNEIVSKPNYIPWKKKYFRFKSGEQRVKEEISDICKIESMDQNTLCLIGLIRYMKSFFSSSQSRRILPAIKKHSKYEWAVALLAERAPDCITNEVPCVGSIVTALCIVSSHVKEILEILSVLAHHESDCSVIRASECLHCIATFFNYFRLNFSINPGFHYRVYYALYSFESGTPSDTVQQTIGRGAAVPEIRFTSEQLQVINHPLGPNQIIKVVAFAGTGKTSTMAEFAKMWPQKQILNVCYNKSVKISAARKFPNHVTCTTIHSLAYKAVGVPYGNKGKVVSNLYSFGFTNLLQGESRKDRACNALKAVNNFVSSADEFITTIHAPEGKKKNNEFIYFTIEEKIVIRDDATTIWNAMLEFKTYVTHDVYLKIYQLSRPTLNFDCLLVDEAQDLNPAMADILLRQKCSKVLVGDPHQQIYSYKGALNTLNSVRATHTYHLTQSFRFGPEIAYIASCALETMKKEEKTIVGTLSEGKTNGERGGQVAIIARRNFSIFVEAAKFCDENLGRTAAFLGGLESYGFSIITDLYKLYKKQPGTRVDFQNKRLARFESFWQLVTETEASDDNELLGKLQLVECYKDRIPELFENISNMCNHYPQEQADVIFSTTHKAKGQEFDTVVLTNDFIATKVQNDNRELKYANKNDDESNILYVALTRAKYWLVMSDSLVEMLLVSGERFEKIVCTKDDQVRSLQGNIECCNCGAQENVECCNCGVLFAVNSNRNFVLERVRVKLSSSYCINGGILCSNCATSSNLNISNYSMHWMQNPSANDVVRPSLKFLLGPKMEEKTQDKM